MATFPEKDGQFKVVLDSYEYGFDCDVRLEISLPSEYLDRVKKQLCEQYGLHECEDCERLGKNVKAHILAGSGHRHDPATEIVELCEKCKNKREREE